MIRTEERLEDGRRILYYSFGDEEEMPCEDTTREGEAPAEPGDRAAAS